MNEPAAAAARTVTTSDGARACSRAVLGLALALLAATFLLISPRPGQTFPGAIPWGDAAVLRRIIDWMSLQGLLVTVRGVEIKDVALHLAAALGLAVLAGRQLIRPRLGFGVRGTAATYAQLLLAGWVLLSLLSSLWSGEPEIARGQGLLYALSLGWAVSLAATLERRDLPALLYGLVVISALGALLCVWYFYERNPHHRPSFPLGNPNTLAAAVVPAVLVCVAAVARTVSRWLRARRLTIDGVALGCALALVPLLWCLALTRGRGALLALVVGVVAMAVSFVGRRLRWILGGAAALGLCGAGTWWLYTSSLDVAMARGATIRFRLYAWRYAAELWELRPITGSGAGAYPRLAGSLSVHDRALDPAAFMRDIIGHAHNELFEVLTEIGLVGGVTFVGGIVATLFAALALLRARRGDPEHWLLVGLVGGIVALLADAMTGVSLRVPGVGAILFTLLGALWAMCRGSSKPARTAAPTPPATERLSASAAAGALVCLAAAVGAGWLTWQNLAGLRAEHQAAVAYDQGRHADVLQHAEVAEARLLDPVRQIWARERALMARFVLAGEAFQAWRSQRAMTRDAATTARSRALEAFEAAGRVRRTAPAIPRADVVAARSAEWLSQIYQAIGFPEAPRWQHAAQQAWRRQRERTPFDVETLLALRDYPAPLAEQIGLLRDALRSMEVHAVWLRPWVESLAELAQQPGFDETLGRFLAVAGPITAETDLDALIVSLAPEAHRLAAAWHGLQGDYDAAARQTGRAAELYEPMRIRFPKLRSMALAEQADYTFRGQPRNPAPAIVLLRAALDALPEVQAQEYAEMAARYRFHLARCLLAAGEVEQGVSTVRQALGEHAGDERAVGQMLRVLLDEATAAGVPQERVAAVRGELCVRFPALCGPDGAPEDAE